MNRPTKNNQLWLFPFAKTARDVNEFILNILMLKEWRQGGVFRVEINEDKYDEFVQRALAIGAYVTTRRLTESFSKGLLPFLEDPPKCKTCGAPAIYTLECSCGSYAWCEEHEDIEVFWNHADHDCSPECCKRGHTAEKISITELENSISPIEIVVEENSRRGNSATFTVKVKQKTEEERVQELEYLIMMRYSLEELEGKLKSITFEQNPLAVGSQASVTPTFDTYPILALTVVRNKPVFVEVVEKKSDWEYLCLLPENLTVPGHSRPYQVPKRHCVLLDRSELEEIST